MGQGFDVASEPAEGAGGGGGAGFAGVITIRLGFSVGVAGKRKRGKLECEMLI